MNVVAFRARVYLTGTDVRLKYQYQNAKARSVIDITVQRQPSDVNACATCNRL